MTMRVRTTLAVAMTLAVMGLAGCDHYVCSATFGDSSCAASPGGVSPGGGSGSSNATAYAYHADQAGGVDGYVLDETAGTFLSIASYVAPPVPANLGSVGLVVAQGKYLYAVFQDLQQIYGWTIGSDGSLTAITGLPLSVSLTIGSPTYSEDVVITNPAGTLLFISEAGANDILVYQINSDGTLTLAPGSPFTTTGVEPQNMGMDGLGRFLYVSEDSGDHSGSFIGAYTVSSAGLLQAIGTFTQPLWEMKGDPTGQYLIGISGNVAGLSGTDDPNIYVYNINSTTGAISAVPNSPFLTLNPPFQIAVQPASTSGALIYSFSYNAVNPIEGYQLNTTTGAVAVVAGSPFTGLSSSAWGQFDPSGNYLFFYNGEGATGGTTTTRSGVNAYVVPSTGNLGTIDGPGVLFSTLGYWAVADVP